jgi:hypothetical protein
MLVGCLIAGAPLHRCVGFTAYLIGIVLLAISLTQAWVTKSLITAAIVPLGLIVAQVVFHPRLPNAELFHRWAVRLLIAGIVVSACASIGQLTIGRGDTKPFRIDPEGQRTFLSSGLFSMVMGILAFLLTALIPLTEHKIWRWFGLSSAAINVIICGARGALIGLVVALGAWLMSHGKKYIIIGGASVIVLGLLAIGMMKWTQPERLEKLLALEDGRWPIWKTSLAIVNDHRGWDTSI